jgi:hypothetical protein
MAGHDFFANRQNYFLNVSSTFRGGLYAALVVGLVALGIGFTSGDPTRAWGALIFNTFFFFSIALGGVAFCGMQDVIGAVWGRPIRRLHEAFSAFLPVASVLFLIVLVAIEFNILGAGSIFSWIENPSMLDHFWGKKTWLQKNFMIARDIVCLGIICTLAHWQVSLGTVRDAAFVAGKTAEAKQMGIAARDQARYWSAPILFIYAVCYTVIAFDFLMSLSPMWFSTLWGGWCFAIMMQTLMASLLIAMFGLRETSFGHFFKRQQFHDVGKLMHGFTVFFGYLTYAHILTYWYGNVPEETEYYIHRLHGPWLWFVMILPFFNFVIPLFVMIFKASKWTKQIAVPMASIILVAQWGVYLLIVMPDTVKGPWTLPWVELGAGCFVLGAFLTSFVTFAKKNPMLPLADPLLQDSLGGGH